MSSIPPNIEAYFKEISERLWTGHASVMIGAGFSKNAINTINPDKSPPNWQQLGDSMYVKLHGEIDVNKIKYMSLLKLAEEFEASYGRPALEHFISKAIADNEYEPSNLHSELMELPWADVLTTNYDTLLERSCKDVFSRKYDIVVNQNDLIYSSKPRIIKLHGSLPSERPLIITEEDYRCYPKAFAPFVNTVQQSLLENTLCLIGFSGDDPNFLQWIGWINDNLGKSNAPKIYLIGVLNLSASQEKLLSKKNIIPLDLSGWVEVGQNHSKAITVFLAYLLKQKQSRENLSWPLNCNLTRYNPENLAEKLPVIIAEWEKCRIAYPNWVILPHQHREYLWSYTSEFFFNTSVFSNLKYFKELDYLYELNWRLEKCLIPIFNEMAPYISSILNKYNFFPDLINNSKEVSINDYGKIDLEKYKKRWIHLTLSLLRFYREENQDDNWHDTFKTLSLIQSNLSSDETSFFFYEQVLNSIAKMRLKEAKSLLNNWPQDHISVFWNMKRATLLFEFGDEKDALKILESGLLTVRKKLNLSPIENDFIWVSQEAYTMFLLKMIRDNIRRSTGVSNEISTINAADFNERWNDLLQYKCDPWAEKKFFDTVLQQPYSKSNQKIKSEFEIGRKTRTLSFGKDSSDSVAVYSFLRYSEELAIPLSLSLVNFEKKTISGLLKRLGKMSHSLGTFILNRNKEEDTVDVFFDRSYLNKLDLKTVDSYVAAYLNFFEENSAEIESIPLVTAFAKKIPFLLSRLCTKCSEDLKLEIFRFYKLLYSKKLALPKTDILLKSLINSSNNETLFRGAITLLDIPVVEFNSSESLEFMEPFHYINTSLFKEVQFSLNEDAVNFLLKEASKENGVRTNAIKRLIFLYDTNLLNAEQSEKLFEVIWGQVNNSTGFPTLTNYYNFAFINWLQPENIDALSLFKSYISNNTFSDFSPSDSDDRYSVELLYGSQSIKKPKGVMWTIRELEGILTKLENWLRNNNHRLTNQGDDYFSGNQYEKLGAKYKNLIDILSNIFGYRINELSPQIKERIKDLITTLESRGVPVFKVKIALGLFHDTSIYFQTIQTALLDKKKGIALDALESAKIAMYNSPYQDNAEFQEQMFTFFKTPLDWRLKELMIDIFDTLKFLVRQKNFQFNSIINSIDSALQYVFDTESESPEIVLEEHIELMSHAISLAGVIYKRCEENNESIPTSILNWKGFAENTEEFADIRNLWYSSN